jgi:hypothetical protein
VARLAWFHSIVFAAAVGSIVEKSVLVIRLVD